jgi:hypothetical protein
MLDTSYSSLFIGDNLFSLMQKKKERKTNEESDSRDTLMLPADVCTYFIIYFE